MATKIYANGTADVTVPSGSKIAVSAPETAVQIYQQVGFPNYPSSFSLVSTITNSEYLSAAMTAETVFRINAGVGGALYQVGTAPQVSTPVQDIVGVEDPFNATGLSAAQGGAITVTGGTSSTSANAGGAANLVGGTPGATGVGGAATVTAGAGGATSGNGGVASVVGGAGTAGNATGGVASLTGGAGQGSGLGGAATVTGGLAGATNAAGGAATVTAGAGQGTGAGAIASLVGGASGAGATGNGGQAKVTGGAAASTNGNGGSVILTGGAKAGTGVAGIIIERSIRMVNQGAPSAKTVSATLTAAEVLAGIITVNQGGGAASAQQLPLATDMDTALPDAAAGDAFDFSMINISAVAAEDASITTNTGWTLVGNMDVASNAAATDKSAGRFRARKTGAGTWSLYRLS